MRYLFLCTVLFIGVMVHGERLPNIIYILADDLGYGDLSCLSSFETPRRLAGRDVVYATLCGCTGMCITDDGKAYGAFGNSWRSEVVPEGKRCRKISTIADAQRCGLYDGVVW